MVLPLIPLVLIGTGVLTGGTGAVNGMIGAGKLKEARSRADRAQKRYNEATASTNRAVEDTNAAVGAYGALQHQAVDLVIERTVDFLRRIQRQAGYDPRGLLNGIDADNHETLSGFGGIVDNPIDVVGGAARAGLTGAAAYAGIPAAASLVGTASTGTALSGLSGAVGQGATMAWLGGGSIASGGGGIALGATALNFVSIGPTMLVTGLVLNGQGEKALTRATAFEGEVSVAVSNQQDFWAVLGAIDTRVDELTRLLLEVQRRAVAALDELEAQEWDRAQHEPLLQKSLRLTFAVRDLVTTPVLAEEGVLNDDTLRIVLRYKEFQ